MNRKISRNEKHKYSEEENLVLVENENKRSNKKLKIPVFSNPPTIPIPRTSSLWYSFQPTLLFRTPVY